MKTVDSIWNLVSIVMLGLEVSDLRLLPLNHNFLVVVVA